jgi:hypothetical protein
MTLGMLASLLSPNNRSVVGRDNTVGLNMGSGSLKDSGAKGSASFEVGGIPNIVLDSPMRGVKGKSRKETENKLPRRVNEPVLSLRPGLLISLRLRFIGLFIAM